MVQYVVETENYTDNAILGVVHKLRLQDEGPGSLCIEMGFYADISWGSRCSIGIDVGAHFYEVLLVFEVFY